VSGDLVTLWMEMTDMKIMNRSSRVRASVPITRKSAYVAWLTFLTICSLGMGARLEDWQITVLSGKPDMVTGNDALVQLYTPQGVDHSAIRIMLNGRDVTQLFRPGRDGSLIARLEGLELGANVVEATAGGKQRARAELLNHSITGPVISGPHQTPFLCQTEGAGLGEPLDSDCSAKTLVTYFYKSTASPEDVEPAKVPGRWRIPRGFRVFDPSRPKPADVAKTTTRDGNTVYYIVRRESGTINRAIYAIALLHRPGEPLPDPWISTPGWNGRLVYMFGGGCMAGYHQSLPLPVVNDLFLSQGYAVATASLNVFGNNCNDLTSTETMMMVKEHFIEQFGVPAHTIGWGGSGGSMQQHLIAQNYPGLLDGLIPTFSFPDIISLITPAVDCALLERTFKSSSLTWSEEQKRAVSGFATWKTASQWNGGYSPGFLVPTRCSQVIPRNLVYDPTSNPGGAKCGIYDNHVNVFGRDPETGLARRAVDNVGVQYGLIAFNEGRISAEQFLDLNERIGGYDAAGKIVPQRTVADPEALRLAYQTGRVNTGGGSLGTIPIIDVRPYVDTIGDVHDRVRSLMMRARLIAANGRAGNQVIWTLEHLKSPGEGEGLTSRLFDLRMKDALGQMDLWLSNMEKDVSSEPGIDKVARNRPPDLHDACWTAAGEKITEPQTLKGTGRCNALFPSHSDPRIAAGAPLAEDALKCALKPIDPKDYTHPLTPGQVRRLEQIFPEGVCDYTRPGIAQQKVQETWRRY
jgi:hypothetical protein